MYGDSGRRRLPRLGRREVFSVILLVGLVGASVGFMHQEAGRSDITVLHVRGAPEGIVFIADPHLREENLNHTRRIIDEINRLDPSLVLIGGDFTYEDEDDLLFQNEWSRIQAPVYAVLGNHDYRSGLTTAGWIRKNLAVSSGTYDRDSYNVSCLHDDTTDTAFAGNLSETLEANGVHVLRNGYRDLEVGGTPLVLVGIDDGWAGMADPPRLPESDVFTIYLIHEPECRADWDADLILAGHTHGGQFLPGQFRLPGMELSGLVERNNVPTYITRGIGTSNFDQELRLFATPEIVVINPVVPPEELFPGKKVVHIEAGA